MSRTSVIGSGQIVGERERQEDALGTAQLRQPGNSLVLVLADGMGGHVGGDVAARLATRTILAYLKAGTAPAWAKLKPALQAANDGIRRAVQANNALEGMGCTLIAATISGGRLRWISVGDSVLFLVRGGECFRLNADHSMRSVFADLVARGGISEDDAAREPSRNALRSAVTGDPIELIDAPDEDLVLRERDLILLVSDGVETLSDAEIARIASRAQPRGAQAVVDALLKAVAGHKAMHQDNASVVVYIHSGGRHAGSRPAAAKFDRRVLLAIPAIAVALLAGWTYWLTAPARLPFAKVVHLPPRPVHAAARGVTAPNAAGVVPAAAQPASPPAIAGASGTAPAAPVTNTTPPPATGAPAGADTVKPQAKPTPASDKPKTAKVKPVGARHAGTSGATAGGGSHAHHDD